MPESRERELGQPESFRALRSLRAIRVSGGIHYLCLGNYRVAERAVQIAWRAEVSLTPDHVGELQLHAHELDQAGDMVVLKLDQHINIAAWTEIIPQYGAEKG
jgi:hypothetical protein